MLGATETRNRFYQVIDSVFSVFSQTNKTLVVFFDDLQWADIASLDLIEHLLTSVWSRHALFIISFRSDELNNNLSLKELYALLEKRHLVTNIELSNFSAADVDKYIRELFIQPVQHIDKLVNYIMNITDGNPLYVNHYIKKNVLDEKFSFNQGKDIWEWDLYSDDLTEGTITHFLDASLESLDEKELKFLRYGFCLKEKFCLEDLILLTDSNIENVKEIAKNLQERGLIITEGNNYIFSHDRILRSVKDISSDEILTRYRANIARVMLKKLTSEELESREEEIVGYFNEVHPDLSIAELEYSLSANKSAFKKAILMVFIIKHCLMH